MRSVTFYLAYALSTVLMLATALLVRDNLQQGITIVLAPLSEAVSTWPLGAWFLILFVLGALTVLLPLLWTVGELKSQLKRFELRKDKAEVKAESTSDQVRVLESKVETLEIALERALAGKP